MRRRTQNAVAWFGFILMLASLAWWEWIPRPPRVGHVSPARPQEPFSLVVLDPGHGGQDSGAIHRNILEKDLTLDVAWRVERLLQAQGLATQGLRCRHKVHQ